MTDKLHMDTPGRPVRKPVYGWRADASQWEKRYADDPDKVVSLVRDTRSPGQREWLEGHVQQG